MTYDDMDPAQIENHFQRLLADRRGRKRIEFFAWKSYLVKYLRHYEQFEQMIVTLDQSDLLRAKWARN